MKKDLILLCDFGLDDAAAFIWLLDHRNAFNKIFVLPIGGNMPLSVAFSNAHRLLFNYEGSTENVIVVDTHSIKQPQENLTNIHGEDGIGDVLSAEYRCVVPTVDFEEWLTTVGTNVELVSLGPCTVTAIILEKLGALPLLIMGGNIQEPPNYNGYEFNHGMDPDAFRQCTTYPHRVGTLDSCHNPNLDFFTIDLSGPGLFRKLARRSVELSAQRKEKAAYIYDLVTVCSLLLPERFTVQKRVDPQGNELSVLCYTSDQKIL